MASVVKDEIHKRLYLTFIIRFIHDPALDEFSFLWSRSWWPIRLGQINFYDFELLLYTRILTTLVSNFQVGRLFKSQLFQYL
jgi:hypothetical protein